MTLRHRIRALAARMSGEGGSATVEFVILFPFFITLFMSSVELGMISIRQSMLERGLDLAVRDVRLGTGAIPQHDDLKDEICEYAGAIPNCENSLRLEMVQVDLRDSVSFPPMADCIDASEPVNPIRNFENGQENALMILRACVKFTPIFPTTGLGKHLQVDGASQAVLIAMSAFVQEPL